MGGARWSWTTLRLRRDRWWLTGPRPLLDWWPRMTLCMTIPLPPTISFSTSCATPPSSNPSSLEETTSTNDPAGTPTIPTTTDSCGGPVSARSLPLFLILKAHEIDRDVRRALGLTASDCVYHLHRCPLTRTEERRVLELLARLTFCAGYTRPDLCTPLLSLLPTLKQLGCEDAVLTAVSLWRAGQGLFGWASLDSALPPPEVASPG